LFASFAKKKLTQRELFLRHVGQTSDAPMALEIVKAEACTLWDSSGKAYIDLIGGISVANTGHRHPKVIAAIQAQLDAYLHIMVYGEFVETPQVKYAQLLAKHLPENLSSVYFTNSGAEAVEGAMKLAKRVTGRGGIVSFNNSYHGSTQGALSIIGDEYWRNAYRPLLPMVSHFDYGSMSDLEMIDDTVACVIVETIQAEAGILAPTADWLLALRKRCDEAGVLLVFDEIQAGFGRTGKLWGFEHFNVIPDILLLGKALGGGMPLGAFISSKKLMDHLSVSPVLGHITTFGGHPVCCAAGIAGMEVLLEEGWMNTVKEKEAIFQSLLKHELIKELRSFGLWMAVEFDSFEICKKVIDRCIEKGVLTDWFLFAPNCMRISPPLMISHDEIEKACEIIVESCGL
jgi:acetylornithine/N-succinyldiaminopimelate aminotransferase